MKNNIDEDVKLATIQTLLSRNIAEEFIEKWNEESPHILISSALHVIQHLSKDFDSKQKFILIFVLQELCEKLKPR